MHPFIVFDRLDWIDWSSIIEQDYLNELQEQTEVVVMSIEDFDRRIQNAYNAGFEHKCQKTQGQE